MAKLYFKYGAMNSGKTTILLQAAYNYNERDQRVLVIKPEIDLKGDNKIISRLGVTRDVDYLIAKEANLYDIVKERLSDISCILVDEAQFLTKEQIDDLFVITKGNNIPVICYGLRSDFKTNAFPGSLRLFELADSLEEMKTICRCGKSARFNGRMVNGTFVSEGAQVAIDEFDNVTYESLCGVCYLEKVKGKQLVKK